MLCKESQVTIFFGAVKIMATTVGETAQTSLMINLNLDGYPYLEREIKLSCGIPFKERKLYMQENQNKMKISLNKVPQVTMFFWIIKVLCTTVGETFADFINFNIGLGLTLTTIIMGVAFFLHCFFNLKQTNMFQPFTG